MSSTHSGEADYILQAKTKAVVFTHINLKPEEIDDKGEEACIREYVSLFERYLACRNVGLVYLYLSLGAEEIVRLIANGKPLTIPPRVLRRESRCQNILQLAETRARDRYLGKPQKFIHVTTTQLASLFERLHAIDPDLITSLGGSGKNFGYDSPKFIEAVIRIARGQDPRSASFPIVRFDEDVQVSEKSLDKLLEAYEGFLATSSNLYFFFSGCYGDPDEPGSTDPINDRAIRVHYLVDKQFRRQGRKARMCWFVSDQDPALESMANRIKLFWRDLGEVGATLSSRDDSPSLRGQSLTTERGFIANRRSLQVTSGAGLIMSLRAIQDLPPFMNMNRLIVWVDDHLKRQLHERIDDISRHDLESVAEARFQQDRHPAPDYISQDDVDWATSEKEGYIERILAGCIMDALVSRQVVERHRFTREPTEYAQAIKTIIANPNVQTDYSAMRPILKQYAEQRCREVLSLWQSPEFEGTDLYRWAEAWDAKRRDSIVEDVLNDAEAYLELVKNWRSSFAAAIGRLRPIGNYWLFERVR